MTESTDEVALRRLHDVVLHAIDTQDGHVADQLRAAMRDGKTSFRIEERESRPADDGDGVVAAGVFAVVEVDGYDVCEVDVRKLI